MPAIGPSFKIDNIEPWAVRRAPLGDRIAYWTAVAVFVIEAKEEELIMGLDRYGNPMAELAEITKRHRRSAMGPADPEAPPLQPAHSRSRTRSMFRAEPTPGARGVVCWWAYDDVSGDSWGEILAYHRAGGPHLPQRDVIGLSPLMLFEVKSRAEDWWADYLDGGASEPELLLGPTTGIDIDGHHYDLQVGTAADIEEAISRGTWSGWGTVTTPRPGPTFGFDPVTFTPPMTRANVVIGEGLVEETMANLARVLGPDATPELAATLAGAQAGMTATVTPGWLPGSVLVDTVAEGVHIIRQISVYNGEITIQNVLFELAPELQGQGIGTDVLAEQIAAGQEAGVSSITLAAAGSIDDPDMVGYKVWPKMGFDGPLPPRILDILPPEFASARMLSDLYATPEGVAWWEANGVTIGLTLDLTPGSYSMELWQAYLDAR